MRSIFSRLSMDDSPFKSFRSFLTVKLIITSLLIIVLAVVAFGFSKNAGSVSATKPRSSSTSLANAVQLPVGGGPISDQVAWLCQHASQDVLAHKSDGFLNWVNQLCTTKSTSYLVKMAAAPPGGSGGIGALMCVYNEEVGASPNATPSQKSLAYLCQHPWKETPVLGIDNNPGQPPYSFHIYAKNNWVGIVNGSTVTVWAGIEPQSSDSSWPGSSTTGEVDLYIGSSNQLESVTVPNSGSLTIISGSSDTLELLGSNGSHYFYNVATNSITPG